MTDLTIRPLEKIDREWVSELTVEFWGSDKVVTRGVVYDVPTLDGFVALAEGNRAGFVTYRVEGDELEILTLNSLEEGTGIGSALVGAVKEIGEETGCRRIWLITTNDNLAAVRFYQKRGFCLANVYPNALEQSRRLKPEIPQIGLENIPIRDEIELEFLL